MTLNKQAFNDMFGKGWDSAKQYSFCIQRAIEGDPQFWWVWEVLDKHPTPPGGWNSVNRDSGGRFKSFPQGKSDTKASVEDKIVKLACAVNKKGHTVSATRLLSLAINSAELI